MNPEVLDDREKARAFCRDLGVELAGEETLGDLQLLIFEITAENRLTGPVFITSYPTEVSPSQDRTTTIPPLWTASSSTSRDERSPMPSAN